MKRKNLLYVIPICAAILLSPISAVRAGAVTVDIKSNYDEGLISEENDGSGIKDTEVYTPASEASSSASSASSASTANNAASTASSATNAAASAVASAASSEASSVAEAASTAAAAVSTTTDLPKTGDDNRIMITFTVMLTSLAIFLTAFLAEKVGKKA